MASLMSATSGNVLQRASYHQQKLALDIGFRGLASLDNCPPTAFVCSSRQQRLQQMCNSHPAMTGRVFRV